MLSRSSFASLRRGAFSVLLLGLAAAPASAQWPYLMSRTPSGSTGDSRSTWSSVSGDGHFVAFESSAKDLVDNDTNGRTDVFVRDRVTHTTVRASIGPNGRQANGSSMLPSISADGRWVSFRSGASNLVAGDTNGVDDIFVHDLHTGETTRVSLDSNGVEANDRPWACTISGDGRLVVFESEATNLVAGDKNSASDVFLHDRVTGTTVRVSLDEQGNELPFQSGGSDISANGLWVSFMAGVQAPSDDDDQPEGSWMRYARYEVATGLVKYFFDPYEKMGGTCITEDGSAIWGNAKHHAPDNYWHIAKITESDVDLVTVGLNPNAYCIVPSVSGDGNRIVFQSPASNLVPDDTNGLQDIFTMDLSTMEVVRVSKRISQGTVQEPNKDSRYPDISLDGRYASYTSVATNLTSNDSNGEDDVFLGWADGEVLDLWYDPPVLYPKERFLVVIEGGEPRTLGLQFIMAINGVPFIRLVNTGRFDSEARWVRGGTVPRGLSGLTLTVASFALGPFGNVLMSPQEDVEFR